MSKATEKEQATRIADLEGAMRAIGRLLADTAAKPATRIERAVGILAMYGCETTEEARRREMRGEAEKVSA